MEGYNIEGISENPNSQFYAVQHFYDEVDRTIIMTRQIGNKSESSLRVNIIPDQKKFQAKNEISSIHSSSTRSHTMV